MTMKKLMLATAIALVLSTTCYAQDGNNNGGTTSDQTTTAGQSQAGDNSASDEENTAQQVDSSSDDDDGSDADILKGTPQEPSVLESAAKEDSKPDPEEEAYPGAPLPPGVAFGHSYPEQVVSDGVCTWHVVTYLLFTDGHSEWRHYDTKVDCPESQPTQLTQDDANQLLQMLFPTQPDTSVEELQKTLEKDPGAADDLGLGKGTDKPALADPHAGQQPSKTENKRTELSRDETMNKTGEKAPSTEQKSETAKPEGKSVQAESKSKGNAEQSSKPVGGTEHSMRTVTHDQPVASQNLAHVGETAHMGEMRTEGMHEVGSHMGSLGGMHIGNLGGLGSLGGMHISGLGGLGGMHMSGLGSLGGMHMGGFGRR